MEETTTDRAETTEETVRGRMPEDEVASYIMSMAANLELPPPVVADAAQDEEEDDVPLAEREEKLPEPVHVMDEKVEEMLRRLRERQAARREAQAARMERIYDHLEQIRARIHTELCAKGYVEVEGDYDENVARVNEFSLELQSQYSDFTGLV